MVILFSFLPLIELINYHVQSFFLCLFVKLYVYILLQLCHLPGHPTNC